VHDLCILKKVRGAFGDPDAEHSRLSTLGILMEGQGAVKYCQHTYTFCGLEWQLVPVSEHDRSCAPAPIMHQESTPDVRAVLMPHKCKAYGLESFVQGQWYLGAGLNPLFSTL